MSKQESVIGEYDVTTSTNAQNLPELLEAGHAVQQIRTNTQMQVSLSQPRDIKKVLQSAVQEAELMGEEFFYLWSVKDKKTGRVSNIDGIGYEGAVMLLRNWKNCTVQIDRVDEDATSWVFHATFVDFESNVSITRSHQMSKGWVVYGNLDDARKETIRFEIGQSKAIRNVALAGVPKWLQSRSFSAAKDSVKNAINKMIKEKGLEFTQTRASEKMFQYGIDEAAICKKFRIENIKALTADHLAVMAGDLSALIAGDMLAQDLYPLQDEKAETAPDEKGSGKQRLDAMLQKEAEQPAKAEEDELAEEAARTEFIEASLGRAFEDLNEDYMQLKTSGATPSLINFWKARQQDPKAPNAIKKMKSHPGSFKELWNFDAKLAAELLFQMNQSK